MKSHDTLPERLNPGQEGRQGPASDLAPAETPGRTCAAETAPDPEPWTSLLAAWRNLLLP